MKHLASTQTLGMKRSGLGAALPHALSARPRGSSYSTGSARVQGCWRSAFSHRYAGCDGRKHAGTGKEQGELCRVLGLLGFSKPAQKVAAAQFGVWVRAFGARSFVGMQKAVWSCLRLHSIWLGELLKEDIVGCGWIWAEVSQASLNGPVQMEFLVESNLHSRQNWAWALRKVPTALSDLLCNISWDVSGLEVRSYPTARPWLIP